MASGLHVTPLTPAKLPFFPSRVEVPSASALSITLVMHRHKSSTLSDEVRVFRTMRTFLVLRVFRELQILFLSIIGPHQRLLPTPLFLSGSSNVVFSRRKRLSVVHPPRGTGVGMTSGAPRHLTVPVLDCRAAGPDPLHLRPGAQHACVPLHPGPRLAFF